MNELTQLNSVKGHLAKPGGEGPWPAMVVIQEWWGLDDQTKSIADRFAQEGYLAFAPDLFHGELAQLGDNDKASTLAQKYGPTAANDLGKVFDGLKDHPDATDKVGSVGFNLENIGPRPLAHRCDLGGINSRQRVFDYQGSLVWGGYPISDSALRIRNRDLTDGQVGRGLKRQSSFHEIVIR